MEVRGRDIEAVLQVLVDLTRRLVPPTDLQLSGDDSFTRTQLEILSLITHASEPVTVTAAAQALQVAAGAVTQGGDGLVVSGMVRRHRAPHDGRARILELAPGAEQMIAVYESAIVTRVGPWFAALDDTELAALARLLGKIRTAGDVDRPAPSSD